MMRSPAAVVNYLEHAKAWQSHGKSSQTEEGGRGDRQAASACECECVTVSVSVCVQGGGS